MARAEVHVKLTEVDEVKELLAAAAERIQQLEAAISSVRALHREHEGRCVACVEWCDCFDSTKELGNDREVARAAMLCPHGNVSWRCPTIAALDSSGTAREVHTDWRAGYDAAVEEMRGVVSRTGSPAANWAALYLASQRKYVERRVADSNCVRCGQGVTSAVHLLDCPPDSSGTVEASEDD